jgi:hypothetical protein
LPPTKPGGNLFVALAAQLTRQWRVQRGLREAATAPGNGSYNETKLVRLVWCRSSGSVTRHD